MGERRVRTSAALAFGTAAMVGLTGIAPAAWAEDAAQHVPAIDLADAAASAQTRSLFSFLDETRGQGVLFGHQHTTDVGITFAAPGDGVQSDVFAGVGDHPAVFGWDTLVLDGFERPGVWGNTPEQNAPVLAAAMSEAHALGGINTLSAHLKNFVTGGGHDDTTGRVVRQILPGGAKNAEFNDYLDVIASTALQTRDVDGALIPIIFRPFHENNGSWFWWGAEHATSGEYKEIFRYTVEYLRDTKGVSNFLYAYSPGGPLSEEDYLKTYPGDEYIDILGYDSYETSNESDNSDVWISAVVDDLAMISALADDRGKIAALTEFGRTVHRALKPSGNKSLTFFTDLLNAIQANPAARRIAYMQTWTNGGMDQFYVPWPAYDGKPAHEIFPDFQAFANDPRALLADDLPADVYTRKSEAAPAEPYVHVVSPADGQRVNTPTTTVRAKVLAADPDRVFFTVEGSSEEHALTLGADGYYSAEWRIGGRELTNHTVRILVSAVTDGQATLVAEADVILGDRPARAPGSVDDFEGYGDDIALNAEYVRYGYNELSLSTDVPGSGTQALEFAYDFSDQKYTGFGTSFSADWSNFDALNLWLRPDGSNQSMVLRVVADGVFFEAYPSLAGREPKALSIPFGDFRAPSGDTANSERRLTAAELSRVTAFSVYIFDVAGGTSDAGSVYFDDIRAVDTDVARANHRIRPGGWPHTRWEPGLPSLTR